MSDTWSSTPPTEPGWWWHTWRESKTGEWEAPEPALLEMSPRGLPATRDRYHDLYLLKPRVNTLWGPKIEDPEPPEVPK